MTEYKVYENQTLLDVSIHVYGSVAMVMELSVLNSVSLTQKLVAGQIIKLVGAPVNALVKRALTSRGIIPSTGFNGSIEELIPDLGIGTMRIGSSFQIAD